MDEQTPFGALAGLKVIDLTRVLGGPFCTQMLGDHGADITKLEPPQGDETRDWGPPSHEDIASYFVGVNRNKRTMGLDLAKAEGRDVLLRLLEGADVLIENFKPGTMEKWGLGYTQVLSKRFPRLIHARISGFGDDGPYGGYPGYDAIIQAMTGWFSVNGTSQSGPTRCGIPMVDMGTGLYTAVAILMAIIERGRSNQGQYIDMTLYDCAVSLMHPHGANYFLSGGKIPVLTGNQHPNISPYDKFTTRTTEIFLGAGNNRAFKRLCHELGAPELADDPRFAKNQDRVINREALTEALQPLLAKADGFELCDTLLKAGLPAGPVRNTREGMEHEHTRQRQMVWSKDWYQSPGTPIKFSRTPGQMRRKPAAYAQDTHELLKEHGFGDEEIQKLIELGILPMTQQNQS